MSSYGACYHTAGLRLTMGPNLKQKPNRVVVQSLDSSTLSNTLQRDPILRNERRSLPPLDAQKVKIGIYFASWWALNIVFNIYNKKVLNTRVPLPMAYLARRSFIMLILISGRYSPRLCHIIGHVTATGSMSKVERRSLYQSTSRWYQSYSGCGLAALTELFCNHVYFV